MPSALPPEPYAGTPYRRILPAGTRLHRVHRATRAVTSFSPVRADPNFGGGRFDCVAGDLTPYNYLYAGFDQRTALAETLLRGLPFHDDGFRILLRAAVAGKAISSFDLTADLTLLSLTTAEELAEVCQDEWLVHTEAGEYGQTRRWAQWLRKQAPWAQGMIWPSKRNLGELAVVLFEDRCGPDSVKPGGDPPRSLDDDPGRAWLNQILEKYRVVIG